MNKQFLITIVFAVTVVPSIMCMKHANKTLGFTFKFSSEEAGEKVATLSESFQKTTDSLAVQKQSLRETCDSMQKADEHVEGLVGKIETMVSAFDGLVNTNNALSLQLSKVSLHRELVLAVQKRWFVQEREALKEQHVADLEQVRKQRDEALQQLAGLRSEYEDNLDGLKLRVALCFTDEELCQREIRMLEIEKHRESLLTKDQIIDAFNMLVANGRIPAEQKEVLQKRFFSNYEERFRTQTNLQIFMNMRLKESSGVIHE